MGRINLGREQGIRVTEKQNTGVSTQGYSQVSAGLSAQARATDNLVKGMQHISKVTADISHDMAETRNAVDFADYQMNAFKIDQAELTDKMEADMMSGKINSQASFDEAYKKYSAIATQKRNDFASTQGYAPSVFDKISISDKNEEKRNFAHLSGRFIHYENKRIWDKAENGINEAIKMGDQGKANVIQIINNLRGKYSKDICDKMEKDGLRKCSLQQVQFDMDRLNNMKDSNEAKSFVKEKIELYEKMMDDEVLRKINGFTLADTYDTLRSWKKVSQGQTGEEIKIDFKNLNNQISSSKDIEETKLHIQKYRDNVSKRSDLTTDQKESIYADLDDLTIKAENDDISKKTKNAFDNYSVQMKCAKTIEEANASFRNFVKWINDNEYLNDNDKETAKTNALEVRNSIASNIESSYTKAQKEADKQRRSNADATIEAASKGKDWKTNLPLPQQNAIAKMQKNIQNESAVNPSVKKELYDYLMYQINNEMFSTSADPDGTQRIAILSLIEAGNFDKTEKQRLIKELQFAVGGNKQGFSSTDFNEIIVSKVQMDVDVGLLAKESGKYKEPEKASLYLSILNRVREHAQSLGIDNGSELEEYWDKHPFAQRAKAEIKNIKNASKTNYANDIYRIRKQLNTSINAPNINSINLKDFNSLLSIYKSNSK
jgi:hypothetical protein